MQQEKSSVAKRVIIAIAIIVVVALVCAGAWWVNDYYHADDAALAIVADENGDADGVTVQRLSDKAIAFVPEHPECGFIFYPGAKVQPEAYAPLMQQCAERGILCVLVKPLFNLSILDANLADGIEAQFPAVDDWMIGGHSLGGAIASDYAARHEGDFTAIVFLAAYPTADLAAFDGQVLSMAGSNDGVLNWNRYDAATNLLPADAKSQTIEGGNHAYFGNYGEQAGDGTATITRAEQQAQAVDAIAELM